MSDWNGREPIYLQLRHMVLQRILNGSLAEGEPVPSVRQVSGAEHINPITVSKAYQMLVDEGLLEVRRGLGMFVMEGARAKAIAQESEAFLREDWPKIKVQIKNLDLDLRDLLGDDD